MDQNSAGIVYLKNDFSRISDAKIKLWLFVGPQIRELTKYLKFEDQLSEVEIVARKSLKNVITLFFWGGGGDSKGRKPS